MGRDEVGLSEFGVGIEGRSGGVATRAERMRSAESEESSGREEGLGARMLRTRTVLVSGQVDDKLAEKTIAQLLILDAESHDPIRVMITSQGGHVDSGFAIHDVLRFIDSPVVTIGAGWVASIAVPILFGAPKERRYSLPHTRFLLHQPSGGAGGQASDIRIEAEEILKVRERLNQLIAGETGQPVERVAKDSDRNFWMDASQALDYGLVGRVVTRASEIGA
ncbi:MAG TPA: ATP-dependent Clp protease proteolytic subunit [Myxococcota bacterium]|nr:ATP-dependent Clp protease proteolytic subunit [Myxococcota bacterium]